MSFQRWYRHKKNDGCNFDSAFRFVFIFFSIALLGLDLPAQTLSTGGSGSLSTGGARIQAQLTPVPGSSILSLAYPLKPSSATAFLTQEMVRLEKIVGSEGSSQLKQQESKIRSLISGTLDLNRLAERALAAFWSDLGKTAKGKKDRERYRQLFQQLVEENYIEKAKTYVTGKYQIPLLSETTEGDRTIISGEIKKTDVNLRVEFHLMSRPSGSKSSPSKSFRVVDVKLDETSLEATYRSSFNRIIRKQGGLAQGFPELLKVMERRLSELKKGVATKL